MYSAFLPSCLILRIEEKKIKPLLQQKFVVQCYLDLYITRATAFELRISLCINTLNKKKGTDPDSLRIQLPITTGSEKRKGTYTFQSHYYTLY